MGDVIEFQSSGSSSSLEPAVEFSLRDDEHRLARRVRLEIEKSGKVQGNTRRLLAQNLGRILARYGRELSRDELARIALNTTNIKPSERLGRFQIKPGKKHSESAEKRLSKNPQQYLKLVETAAQLTGDNCETMILELVDATRFDPKSDDKHDVRDFVPHERLEEVIRARCELISEKTSISEYLKSRKEYRAVPTRNKYENTYSFETEMEHYYSSNLVSSVRLFSIKISDGTCEWREENGPWIERSIELLESVKFEIFADENQKIFGAFRISPHFCVLPKIRNDGKRGYYREMYSELPQDIEKAWMIAPDFFRSGVLSEDGERFVPAEESSERKCSIRGIVRLPENNELDLTRYNEVWKPKIPNPPTRWLDGSNTTFVSPIVDRLSIGSVSKWLDVPIESIRRLPGDAYRFEGVYDDGSLISSKFDASRGISPPSSMMAEIEVSLYFEGRQGSLDRQKENSDLFEIVSPGMYWEDEDGEVYEEPEHIIDRTYVDNFLDVIESDISAQCGSFFEWREEARKDGLLRSALKLEELYEELHHVREVKKHD